MAFIEWLARIVDTFEAFAPPVFVTAMQQCLYSIAGHHSFNDVHHLTFVKTRREWVTIRKAFRQYRMRSNQ